MLAMPRIGRSIGSVVGLLLLGVLTGCPITTPPPIASGAIDVRALEPGGAGVQLKATGGGWMNVLPYAHGSAHLDIGLPRRWAIRLDGGAGLLSESPMGAGRLGVRNHLVDGLMTLGFGVGAGHIAQALTWAGPDVELALGTKKGRLSVSLALRTGVSIPIPLYYDPYGTGPWLHWVPELGLGIELAREFFLTVSYQGSWGFAFWYPSMSSVTHGGSLGLLARFPPPAAVR